MSESIKHECGIAMIRLLKPLDYYAEKYGTPFYGLHKLYLLMEKQHNRGQDGAGIVTVKLDIAPGSRYISRHRSNSSQPIKDIFEHVFNRFEKLQTDHPNAWKDQQWLKQNAAYTGEVLMGHLRYGTHGVNSIEACHPFLRQSNWKTRNLALAGNFNMTNVDDLFTQLVDLGQNPKERSDTVTVLEKIGHFLDVENQRIFDEYKSKGYNNQQLTDIISAKLDIQRVLSRSMKDFDGGYVMVGLIGNGDSFVARDPHAIRPAYFYKDEEIVVAASERPAIQTAFNVDISKIEEVPPGHALIVKKDGKIRVEKCREPEERKACSFERIYFSRGTDKDIYEERKKLGYLLAPKVLKAVENDLDNTVFSFVPNTAEVAFYGLLKGVEEWLNKYRIDQIINNKEQLSDQKLEEILNLRPRVEKIAVKDAKMRTFISQDEGRNELVSHVYDITYGSINPNVDTLVVMDDSIVRGTTLKQSILSILDRLGPKKIIIVSSAPQIRYPDCYGIDMSKLGEFVAFKAAVELTKERGNESFLKEIYKDCIDQQTLPATQVQNHVKRLYDQFTDEEISAKISEIVKPKHIFSEVEIMYQSIENLHEACPNNKGDWYFSGNFPTPGGNKVVNRAFINYMEGKNVRAY